MFLLKNIRSSFSFLGSSSRRPDSSSRFSKEEKDEEDNEFALLEKAQKMSWFSRKDAGEPMRKMGDEARRNLAFELQKIRDVLYMIYAYLCEKCEKTRDEPIRTLGFWLQHLVSFLQKDHLATAESESPMLSFRSGR